MVIGMRWRLGGEWDGVGLGGWAVEERWLGRSAWKVDGGGGGKNKLRVK